MPPVLGNIIAVLLIGLLIFVCIRNIKNRYLHTGGKNHVFSPNCSLYRSDLGFSKTKFINFSTFSK